MATVRNSSARFTRSAIASLKSTSSSSSSSSLSKSRPALLRAAEITAAAAPNGSECLFRWPRIADNAGAAKLSSSLNDAVVGGGFACQFLSSSRSYSTAANSQQINDSEFTEMAWEGVVGALDAAHISKQQVVESEHLMKALMEQKDGLARRIFSKAGLDNTTVLQATDDFISKQPKVGGDTSGPRLGPHLLSILDNARKQKKEMGDAFVSVEHLVLAFFSDQRFGVQLFRNLQLSEKALKDAVQAVRGSQRVTDQRATSGAMDAGNLLKQTVPLLRQQFLQIVS